MHAPFPTTEQRWKAVRAHIAKGDQAKAKAEQANARAEQHYSAAGQHLAALKAEHTGTWAEWEVLVKEKAVIGKSRASELIRIWNGRTTVKKLRADKARSVRKLRRSSPLHSPCSGETAGDPEVAADIASTTADEPDPTKQPENNDPTIYALDSKKGQNPIARAWGKATKSQRLEFALEYKELIAGLVADEEQRRLPYAEQRRRMAERLANDLNTKIETKIGTEENATNGGGADFGQLPDSATAAFAQPPFNQQPQPITPPAGPAQPIAELEPLTSARPWPMVDDAGPIPSFLVRDEAPAGAAAR